VGLHYHSRFSLLTVYDLRYSGLFRDMLSNSIASTSLENPLPVDENACDFEIMLLILIGKPYDAIYRAKGWEHSARLYRLVGKYQLEGHRHWFSQICGQHAAEDPWEALFLACDQSPIDTAIAGHAIGEGFARPWNAKLWDPKYFEETAGYALSRSSGKPPTKGQLLDTSNVSILLGRKLGHSGLLAYTRTFTGLASTHITIDWDTMAQRFVRHVKAIEKANICP
jgi:hypothetical protein